MTDSYNQENINLGSESQVLAATSDFSFRPGATGTLPDNVFTDWNELMVAIGATQGIRVIYFDNSIQTPVIPTGTYDLTDVTFAGSIQFTGTIVDLAPGVTLLNLKYLRRSLILNQTGPTPSITLDTGDVLVADENCGLITAAGPLISVIGFAIIQLFQGAAISGVSPIIDVTAAGIIQLQLNNRSFVSPGVISGVAGAGGIAVIHSNAVVFTDPTGVPPWLGGAWIVVVTASATRTDYVPAVAGDWVLPVPTDVADALDRIASLIGPIP